MQPAHAATFEIFRAGTHIAVNGKKFDFPPEVVAQVAASYDPKLCEAPMVIGHPNLNAPAYGWAKSLRVENDTLYAEPHQVEPAFAEGVNTGRYKKVSACFYLPDSPGNPTPGQYYLRHIGFLGAMAPAVKGLRDAQFAEGDGYVEFASPQGSLIADLFQRLRDYFIERDGADAAEKMIPQWAIRSIESAPADSPAVTSSFAAPSVTATEITLNTQTAEAALATRESDLAARERVLRDREVAAIRSDVASFADGLVASGKLLPAERDRVVEVLVALPGDLCVSFAEAGAQVDKPAGVVLREFLTQLPPRVDFTEKSADDTTRGVASFAAPAGMQVDALALEHLGRAQAYQAQHPNTTLVAALAATASA